MNAQTDAPIQSEADPSLAKLQLRTELTFSLRTNNGKRYMLVKDDLLSRYYRLGTDEWVIAKLFDGSRTMRQVIRDAIELLGEEVATPEEVSRLAHWLVQNELASYPGEANRPNQTKAVKPDEHLWHESLNATTKLGQWNPLFIKFSLPNPRPILNSLYPLLHWLFSRYFVSIWTCAVLAGGYSVFSQWERFRSSLLDVFAADNWLYLLVIWILLKIIHELAHAIACMRYGGPVTRCGLMFIVFSPIAWVDVTSAWSFRSKWHRIMVSAAGMYVEFLVAAIAAIIWARTTDPFVATLTRNIVLSASVTTLLFNLNFLMRFDGYYMLSDLLEIQNLYGEGQQYIQAWRRKHLLGMNATMPKHRGWKLGLIKAYGFAAMIWRVVFCVGILIVAASLFHGAGIVLAIFSGIIWFALPMLRTLMLVVHGTPNKQPNRQRVAWVTGSAIAFATILMCLPWPGRTTAHGFVEFSPLHTIRADSPGFVERISVNPGQSVKQGDVLLTLRNSDLTRELADLDLQIQVQTITQRIQHRNNEMAQYKAVAMKLESLTEQRKQFAAKVDALNIRAPIDGTVIARNLDMLGGKYIETGTELLAVGSTGEKEVRVSIQQADVDRFRQEDQREVRIGIKGHRLPPSTASVERVFPRATRNVLHPALAATTGGPLAVQQNLDDDSDEETMLVEPHFEGRIKVPGSLSAHLHSGELCEVSIGRGHQRVYEKLIGFALAYFESKSAG